jgi:hypothetical protein
MVLRGLGETALVEEDFEALARREARRESCRKGGFELCHSTDPIIRARDEYHPLEGKWLEEPGEG